jgi:tetratricopeptide (TPR) repeat protein
MSIHASDAHAGAWEVIQYDIPPDVVSVEIAGVAARVGARATDDPHVSRLPIRIRVPDVSRLTLIELNGMVLPIDRPEIAREVYIPLGEHLVVDLRVNGLYRLVVRGRYELPPVKPGRGADSGVALAAAALKADPYSPHAYRLLLRRDGDEGALQVLDEAGRNTCRENVARSLTATRPAPDGGEERGVGVNVPALYTLLLSSDNRDEPGLYHDLLLLSPTFAPAHTRLAEIYTNAKQSAPAVRSLYLAYAANRGDAFGVAGDLRAIAGDLREALSASASGPDSGQDAERMLLRGVVEAALGSDRSIIQDWYDRAPSGYRARAAYNRALLWRHDAPDKALEELRRAGHADGDGDEDADRRRDRLLMYLTAGSRNDPGVYDGARWRLSQMDSPTDHDRVLADLRSNPSALDEAQLAYAFTLLDPNSPEYANNLAVVYAAHGFMDAAIDGLCKAVAIAANWRRSDQTVRARTYRRALGNLAKCYDATGRRAHADELRQVVSKIGQG